MSSDEIAIRVEKLSKRYEIYATPRDRLKQFVLPPLQHIVGKSRQQYFSEFWALKDVSFEIKKGEMVGIIGRNGSGKSTLLQMICGTLTPSSGGIQTHGRIAALLELGSGFNPEFTGRENVYMNAAVLGLHTEEIDARFDEIATFADIGEFIGQPVKTYSSGMAVRLAFAVASCVDPEILVVDEALAVGDAVFQSKCFRRFQQLREKGVTVLLVTHDIGTVVQLCNRAFVIHQGVLVAAGLPKDMGDEYRRRCAQDASGDRDLKIPSNPLTVAPESLDAMGDGDWMVRSQNTQEYGDGRATFESFAIFNSKGQLSSQITSGEEITLRLKIRFNDYCAAPIVAFGFRDLSGQELCGTNSWYENNDVGHAGKGVILVVDYCFNLPLQTGLYNLCIACTEIFDKGLVAHHRLYDVAVIEVNAIRRFVGHFDLAPKIKLHRI